MKKHLVFDIDHTLIYTPSELTWYENMVKNSKEIVPEAITARLGIITIPMDSRNSNNRGMSGTMRMVYIIRPKCVEFLKWCFNNFDTVSVWSAGSAEYVKAIVDNLFRKVGRYPHILWTYDELDDGIKPISTMVRRVGIREYMSVKNTLLIDDMKYNFEKHPDNGVLIPPYNPMLTIKDIMDDDSTLQELYEWFNSDIFRLSKDVRHLDKKHIFTRPSWDKLNVE